MDIVVPSYLNADTALRYLSTNGGFQFNRHWNANVLGMPQGLGDGHLMIYMYPHMHIMRGRWNFIENTCFISPEKVRQSNHIDFRITANGEMHSAFLQGAKEYSRDITTGDEVKFFISKSHLEGENRLLDKMDKFCRNKNVSLLSGKLFSLQTESAVSFILLESKLLEFIHLWMDFLSRKDIERNFEGLSDINLRLLTDAKNIIDETLSNPMNIHQLSRRVGLNEFYLKEGFKKMTGLTIRQYIIHARMEKARNLVVSSDMPIGEICHLLGYTSRGHFAQLYLKYFGVLPNEERFQLPLSLRMAELPLIRYS
jgi:AraC-like DNA-binding protein